MNRSSIKRLCVVFMIASLCTFVSGCDYLDIDRLVSVMGVVIDYASDTGDYLVTAEIAKLSEDPKNPVESVVLEGKGPTISAALENMGLQTSGELYYLHSVLFAFGEEAANVGINRVIDTVMRSAQAQRVIHVAIVKGGKASDLMRAKPKTKSLISVELSEAITMQFKRFGTSYDMQLFRLYNDIPAGLSSLLPAIRLSGEGDKIEAELDGTAILAGDKLCGFLSPEDTKYLLLASGEYKQGYLTLRSSELNTEFALNLAKCTASCTPVLRDGRLTIEVDMEIDGTIPEIVSEKIDVQQMEINRLREDIHRQIAENTTQVLNKVIKECRADLFYLQPTLENQYRAGWAEMGNNWPEYMRNAEIKIVPHVLLFSTGISK